MGVSEWKKVGGSGNVRFMWKGDVKGKCVWVRMKVRKSREDRWYVFEGKLNFKEVRDE